MTPDELIAFVRKIPFQPFSIHLTDGTAYEIRHPEQCMVTPSTAVVGIPHPTKSYMQQFGLVSLLHINRLLPIEVSQSTSSNGR